MCDTKIYRTYRASAERSVQNVAGQTALNCMRSVVCDISVVCASLFLFVACTELGLLSEIELEKGKSIS